MLIIHGRMSPLHRPQMQFLRPLGAFNSATIPTALIEKLCFLRDIKSPIILQVSQGGSAYFAGKGLANDKQQASIAGAISAALHIRTVSKAYGV